MRLRALMRDCTIDARFALYRNLSMKACRITRQQRRISASCRGVWLP